MDPDGAGPLDARQNGAAGVHGLGVLPLAIRLNTEEYHCLPCSHPTACLETWIVCSLMNPGGALHGLNFLMSGQCVNAKVDVDALLEIAEEREL